MLGLTWAEIQEDYLQSKTANACIERHKWLMMTWSANGWDYNRMQTLAKEYMSMHEEIWSGLAARVGEKWRVIEEKCMSRDPETSQNTTHEAGTIQWDPPVKLTPITGRVIRARKRVPYHTCDVCQPPKTFTRAKHLRRHLLSHKPPELFCTVSSCEKVFHRKDLLDRHIERHGRSSMIKGHMSMRKEIWSGRSSMIREYMSMRKEIWSGLAARIEEDWRVVEEKCMSTGLNSLQNTARRLEILAKKAKLAELRVTREIRMKQDSSIDQPIEALLMKVPDALPPYPSKQGMPEENTVAPYTNEKQPSKDLYGDHASITQPPIHLTEELTRHPAGLCEEGTSLPSVNDKPSSKDLRSGQISDANIQSPSRAKQRSQRHLTRMHLFSWIKKLLRPRLKPGYRRIEWTCDCGVELYGDFMIDKASDLDGLELSLHVPAENTSTSSSSDSEQSVETGTNPRHMISRSRSSSTRTTLSTSSTNASSIDIAQSKFFALCINTGSIYKTLAELDMSRLNSDGEAFSQMKKAYIQYRGLRSRLRFLIKPVTVEFVRFTLWNLRRGYVSITDRPSSMPPNTRIDYDFVPPPMPPEVFVHYLEHGDGDFSPNRYTWLPRLPKRLNNKVMDCGEATEGWGIHVIEGPNREAVFWVLMITISASVLASVLWTSLKGDIQGGTGLGALIIALPPAIMAAFLFRLGAT